MPPLTALYHRDLGIPANLARPAAGLALAYTHHALFAAEQDGLPRGYLPAALPSVFDLIEVATFAGKPTTWVVRFRLPDFSDWDIVLAVRWDGTVRTVWFNRSDDQHETLDRSRYRKPQ